MTDEYADKPMQYVMSLSGGIVSAVAADVAIRRYGKDNVRLWFADTSWEDDDLYRFIDECLDYWGKGIVIYKDGRTPLEVADDKSLIPNNRMAPCSFVLKSNPFEQFVAEHRKPLTVLLGFDFREFHRILIPRQRYERYAGVKVDAPLMWPEAPLPRDYFNIVRSWGIKPPRLYEMGFHHNNCGGRCVKSGQKQYIKLIEHFPERFEEIRDWEASRSAMDGPRNGKAFMLHTEKDTKERVPYLLRELEVDYRAKLLSSLPTAVVDDDVEDDRFACFCADV